MWAPNRAPTRVQRTSSIHSVSSVHSPSLSKPIISSGISHQPAAPLSSRSSVISMDDERPSGRRNAPLEAWNAPLRPNEPEFKKISLAPIPGPRVTAAAVQKDQWELATDDDATSGSSTLDGEDDYMDHAMKKAAPRAPARTDIRNDEPRSPNPAPHVPGPLESQLAALMSKLIYIEQANPAVSISPEEFQAMQKRVQALEEEKRTWSKRHDAIWALRDEDVENNIKIRGLLAKARRELEETKALREEDLSNVLIVRSKLAEKTRELERAQAQNGRSSPNHRRPGSYLERRGTSDLFVAAKTAALEQRVLELEKRNSDLVTQVDTLKGGANIEDLNRLTAHQAWKDTVGDLEARIKAKDAEITKLRSGSGAGSTTAGMDWYKVEALLEEHATYRESVGGRLQALRSDKEGLQRELHRKENDCQALELKLQTLQRRTTVL
ncbi:hypothetical protein FB567DRAFT_138867 [Paraphoma chrysanthemicola]|uniref:Uncharacterized protein n=1 Tax=Paraphoma chrysanthemicola TaxID=798071 RepID=A0A8K0QXV3_9PLEO|nr:hypothetical protein FB567DRAFT_138867 [Paraphoma chrysanthemicola]